MSSDLNALHTVDFENYRDASLSSSLSHADHLCESRLFHPRRYEMEGPERDVSGQSSSSETFGQLSFAPTTRTTVVTTTTTTTTSFPPLIIKPPRATRDLDARTYPLAAAPTPASLRNIRFKIGDKSVVFKEPQDPATTAHEVRSTPSPIFLRVDTHIPPS